MKNSFIYLFGEILSKGIPLLILPYITSAMGSYYFGEFSLYQTYHVIIFVFIFLSFDAYIIRSAYRYSIESAIASTFSSAMILSVLFAIIIIAFLILDLQEIYFIVLFWSFLFALYSILISYFQAIQDALSYVMVQAIYTISTVLVTYIIFEYVTANTLMRILAINSGFIISLFVSALSINKNGFRNIKLRNVYRLIRSSAIYLSILFYGIPLIFHQLGTYAKGYFDRIIIDHVFSISELGVYTLSIQLSGVMVVFISALNKALCPKFYEALSKNKISKSQFYILLSFLLSLPIPAWFFSILCSKYINMFFSEDYADLSSYLTPHLVGFSLYGAYLLLVNYLYYYSQTKIIAIVSMVSSCIYLLIVFLLSKFSLMHVTLSVLFSNLFSISLLLLFTFRSISLRLR
ncbi:oligosaccharide flippase family protein [Vibrio cholerae]|uniref:oligosaccharide flippase family protein n=1 Tax=Vibrio cholerae TaxID=666 RepID=UPI0001D5AAC4|nr:oligosaccharide flippase family protein [Vibrio cholerae]EFH72968.1 conserved hypothetical protein [Vibrio cholerae RC385]OFI73867.1 hypothetical protein BFX16_01570 [Vibrio cholerae]OFI75039.1 hypothetical protein BFX15_01570 [Vibrio cholerae]